MINEYLTKVRLQADKDIEQNINKLLSSCDLVKSYNISFNFNRYVIDIRLNDYSLTNVEECFKIFNSEISYSYSSLYVRFNEGKCVRYRFVTSKDNKEGFYCDIIFSK